MGPRTFDCLINVSGGVDSTYAAYKYITTTPDENILLHHCEYSKARGPYEKTAVLKLVEYLKKAGYTNFSLAKFTNWSRAGMPGGINDIIPIYTNTGFLLGSKKYGAIDKVLMPRCLEEVKSNKSLRSHYNSGKFLNSLTGSNRVAVAMQVCRTLAKRDIYFFSTYQNLSKKEMLAQLPEHLLQYMWTCRFPKNGKPCGKCFACRRVKGFNLGTEYATKDYKHG